MPELPDSPGKVRSRELLAKAERLCKELRFEEAISCYGEILGIDPNNRIALSGMGTCCLCLGRGREAYLCYNQAHLLEPEGVVPLLNMAQSLLLADRLHEAVECFDKALGSRPGDSELLVGKGVLLLKLGMIDEGLACFGQAGRIPGGPGPSGGSYLPAAYFREARDILERLAHTPATPARTLQAARNARALIDSTWNFV